MTKVLKKKKLKKTKKNVVAGMVVVKPGDRVVTETLATRSEVEVVWQVFFCQESFELRDSMLS